MHLSEASGVFLSVRRQEGFSNYTINAYQLQHEILIRDIGDLDIQKVTLQLLREHLSHNGHLKASSMGHKVRAIKSLFNWLFQEGSLERNPTLKLSEPKIGKRIPKALTMDELELLRDSCQSTLEHALVEFAFATGCRVAEIQQINRTDIDWQRRAVTVLGKGDKEREVYFGAKSRIWLQRYLDGRTDNDRALFVTERRPHRMSIHEVQYIFKRIASRCNLKDKVSPHKMRHTLASSSTRGHRWLRYSPFSGMISRKRRSCTPRSAAHRGSRHMGATLFSRQRERAWSQGQSRCFKPNSVVNCA